MSCMKSTLFSIAVLISFVSVASCSAQLSYDAPTIYGRTGITCFNMPDGSSIASPTISVDDARDVALDVNFVGNTGGAGLFYGNFEAGNPIGGIVFDTSDIIFGDPSQNGNQEAIFTVGFNADLFVYDAFSAATTSLNFPLGATGSSGLTFDSSQRIGGRIRFGNGDAYGVFNAKTAGFPTFNVYATDSDLDASSPYSFLYSPDMSRQVATSNPRIAAKVSTIAGFDFEEIRIFESGGTSTLIAVETEIDPASPFSEFVTNSISISDDGSKVAFQANDVDGNSGIYLYNDQLQTTTLIGSEANALVNSIDFFAPDVNDQGMVVFRGDDALGRSSVFAGDGIELIRVGGEGDMIATDIGLRQLGRRDQDFSQSGAPRINNHGDVGWIMQYFDPTNSNSVADGSLIMLSLPIACLPGDLNLDGKVNLLDVAPFVEAITSSSFSCQGDVNQDGKVNLLDVAPFVAALTGD